MLTPKLVRATAGQGALTLVLGVALAGCNFGKRNVAACDEWVGNMDATFEETPCAGTDFAGLLQGGCEIFEDSKCDISEYFTCLEENTECSDDYEEINTEGWNDCVSLSVCD